MSYLRRHCAVTQRFRSILTAQRRSTNSVSTPINAYLHPNQDRSIVNQAQKRRVYSGTLSSKVGHRVPGVFSNALSGVVGVDMDGGIDARRESIVERIHSTQTKIVLFVTGGGMHIITWLLCVPGASRTVLDVQIPYSHESLNELVSDEIDSSKPVPSATADMAMAMAKAAYRKAVNVTSFGTPVIGVGVSCALATDRSRRGEDKVFVCAYGSEKVRQYHLVLEKGKRSRLQEDIVASELVLGAIATAMGATDHTIETDEFFTTSCLDLEQDALSHSTYSNLEGTEDNYVSHAVEKLISGDIRTVEFSGGMVYFDAPRRNRIYLPGSFNPLHDGHKELLSAAQIKFPGKEGAFELSIGNADKGFLSKAEIERRVKQFIQIGMPVVLTQAPLFTMKADLFPGSTFIVGYDTAVRLVQERYYGSETAMMLQFAKLAHQRCDFLVAGRVDSNDGRFYTLEDMEIPDVLRKGSLFHALTSEEFRLDISSTEIRQRS